MGDLEELRPKRRIMEADPPKLTSKQLAMRPEKGIGRVTPEQKRVFWERIDSGESVRRSAALANFSYATGIRIHEGEAHLHSPTDAAGLARQSAPKSGDALCAEAKRALQDFRLFPAALLRPDRDTVAGDGGRQGAATAATDDEEYLVVNAPPGSGKSTLFTMDLAAWMTCRNRSIRGLIGSRTAKQASWYVGRLRRAFERTTPEKAELMEKEKGRALDAEPAWQMTTVASNHWNETMDR